MKGKIYVNVSFEEEEHKLIIIVADTGIGIRRIDQVKLFQMFGKIDSDKN